MMPKRIFKYGQDGVTEVTPEEKRTLCEEISQDAAARSEPLEFGLPAVSRQYRNVSAKWPVHAESIACSTMADVKAEQKLLREHGVQTDYDEHLRPILRGRAHAKAHKRALGYADPDAGYGDAEPLHYQSGMTREANRKRRLAEARERLIASEYRLFGRRISAV